MTKPLTPSTAAERAAEAARDEAMLIRETASNAATPAAQMLPPDDPVSAVPETPANRS